MPIKIVSKPASKHWPSDTIPTSIRVRRNSSKKSIRLTKCFLISKPNESMMLQDRLTHIPIPNLTPIPIHRTHMPNKILFPNNIPISKEGTITLKEVHKATLNTIPGKTISTIIQVNTADGQLGTSGCTRSIGSNKNSS